MNLEQWRSGVVRGWMRDCVTATQSAGSMTDTATPAIGSTTVAVGETETTSSPMPSASLFVQVLAGFNKYLCFE